MFWFGLLFACAPACGDTDEAPAMSGSGGSSAVLDAGGADAASSRDAPAVDAPASDVAAPDAAEGGSGGASGSGGGAAGGGGAGGAAAGGADAGAPVAQTEECRSCTTQGIETQAKSCKAGICCTGDFATPADKALCERLRDCMITARCWTKNPNECYCGAATGLACATDPKGICLAEALAAAKTADKSMGGIRFFDTGYPSGQATQLFVCQVNAKCVDVCQDPAGSGSHDGGGDAP